MPFVRVLLFLLSVVPATLAQESPGAAEFAAGRAQFADAAYVQAATSFERAVGADPGNGVYHHWLARAYGRSAERSGWFTALGLARRTLAHLQRAVELDPGNRDALEDLRDYYRKAPAFLGGSASRAQAIEARLARTGEALQ